MDLTITTDSLPHHSWPRARQAEGQASLRPALRASPVLSGRPEPLRLRVSLLLDFSGLTGLDVCRAPICAAQLCNLAAEKVDGLLLQVLIAPLEPVVAAPAHMRVCPLQMMGTAPAGSTKMLQWPLHGRPPLSHQPPPGRQQP